MKLNTVDFSDDFYKGETVEVNVNGHYFGKIEPLADKIVLSSLDDDGNTVAVDYDDINTLIDDLETVELAVFVNGESTMSEDELKSEVSEEVVEFGVEVSDEVLDIIVDNVENLLDISDCSIGEAVAYTLNTEGPWGD